MTTKLDVYLRVSRKRDKNSKSLEGQEADSRARVAGYGARVGKVHKDDGKSAWNPNVRREGWEALMLRLESGETNGVCVFDMERFTRQPSEGERLLKAAERGLVVLDSDSEYDLQSPSGRKAFRDHMAAAAYYSDRLSTRVKRGKREKRKRGEVDGRRAFGFENDGITPRACEVAIIRDHVARLLAGEPQYLLMAELNAAGVLSVRRKPWTSPSYRYTITRPRNAGYLVHDGEIVDGVRLPGDPILDEQTWRRIVALFTARRPGRPPSGRYLMTRLAVCSECGMGMVGKPRNNMHYPDGEVVRQYWCSPSAGGCGRITCDARALETWVLDWAVKVLSDPKHADAVQRADEERTRVRGMLFAEQASIEATLVEVAGRLGRQEISLARHDAVAGPLDARLAAIRAELAGLDADEPEPITGRTIPARDQAYLGWLEVATSGSVAERRAMVLRALGGRRLTVGPGRPARFSPDRVKIH